MHSRTKHFFKHFVNKRSIRHISHLQTDCSNYSKIMIRKKNGFKLDGQQMRNLADNLKEQIPGMGFALIVFDFENGLKTGNYISNVEAGFMIKALETQLNSLKNNTAFPTPELLSTANN